MPYRENAQSPWRRGSIVRRRVWRLVAAAIGAIATFVSQGGLPAHAASANFQSVVAARNADGRMEEFAVDGTGTLRHVWQTSPGGNWGTWADIAHDISQAQGEVAIGQYPNNGGFELYAKLQTQTTGDWILNWNGSMPFPLYNVLPPTTSALAGSSLTGLAAAANADGTIGVFTQKEPELAGELVYARQLTAHGTQYTSWGGLGFVGTQAPIAGMNQDGRLEVFAADNIGALWHTWQQQGLPTGWHPPENLGGTGTTSSLALGSDPLGRLEIFTVGIDGAVWTRWQLAVNGTTGWTDWTSLGGSSVHPGIALDSSPDGRMEIFVVFPDGTVWTKWQTSASGPWTPNWVPLGGSYVKGLAVSHDPIGRMDLFAIGGDGNLWHKWQTTPGGSWTTDWVQL